MPFNFFVRLVIGMSIGGIVLGLFGMGCSVFGSMDTFRGFKLLFFISMGLFLLSSYFYIGG